MIINEGSGRYIGYYNVYHVDAISFNPHSNLLTMEFAVRCELISTSPFIYFAKYIFEIIYFAYIKH